ncbi:MAG: EH signature domain-containing protein [Vicinamibacterales bacterium]
MGLRDACTRGSIPLPRLEWSAVPRTARVIEQRWGELPSRQPPSFALAPIVAAVLEHWKAKGTFDGLVGSHRRWLPHVLFYPEGSSAEWPAQDRAFLRAALAVARARAGTVTALLRLFLKLWPTEGGIRVAVQDTLVEALQEGQSPRLKRWWTRVQEFKLLSIEGPGVLAERLLSQAGRQHDVLEAAGIGVELRRSRFMAATERSLCERLRARLVKGDFDELHARLALFTLDGALTLPHQAPDVADALLLPFVSKVPPDEVQSRIQRFLLAHLKDPRLTGTGWLRVKPESRQVMLRWLVGDSLERFFQLISRWATMPEHWTYRKAFWSAYHTRGAIGEAWVVLGDNARLEASRKWRDDALAFGRLSGGGDVNHCVLLLRIGDLMIAEWSHNGKCRFWRLGKRSCPTMYEPEYERQVLQNAPDYEQTHYGNLNYTWQRELAEAIRRETGISMMQTEYRVR